MLHHRAGLFQDKPVDCTQTTIAASLRRETRLMLISISESVTVDEIVFDYLIHLVVSIHLAVAAVIPTTICGYYQYPSPRRFVLLRHFPAYNAVFYSDISTVLFLHAMACNS